MAENKTVPIPVPVTLAEPTVLYVCKPGTLTAIATLGAFALGLTMGWAVTEQSARRDQERLIKDLQAMRERFERSRTREESERQPKTA